MKDHLYLIHFDQPLSHAQHYLGSTTNVKARIQTHAKGDGARLTQVLKEQKLHWTLAAVFAKIDDSENIRILERNAKKRHNSSKYCPICNPKYNRVPPGTIQLPVEDHPFHTTEIRN